MIVMRLKGGLGNQLFQYALGRYLSITKKVPLKLDTSSYKSDTLREYRLSAFNIVATASDKLPFFATDSRLKYLNNLIQAANGIFTTPYQIIKEKGFSFDDSILGCSDNVYLDGFWQSEKYFSKIAQTIREDLTLTHGIGEDLFKTINHISSKNAVSLHVRRGDYVSNPITTAYHGVCELDWYNSAANLIKSKVENPTFFIFSDDYDWVKNNLDLQSDTIFINPSQNGREFDDLIAMSHCKNHIIANSSFSWWGAWLNPSPNKIVIAPSNWFGAGPKNTQDLIPESWIRL